MHVYGSEIVGIVAGLVSIILALVAIWLSMRFYTLSDGSSRRIGDATNNLLNSVDSLKTFVDKMYSDLFAMTRETVTDMRQSIWPRTDATDDGATEALRAATERQIQGVKAEVASEIETLARRVGLAADRVEELRADLAPVFSRALDKTRQLDDEESQLAAQNFVLAQLQDARAKGKRAIAEEVVVVGRERFPAARIVDAIEQLHAAGKILWSSKQLGPATELVLVDQAAEDDE